MEENIKSSNGMKKILKVIGIIAGALVLLVIILKVSVGVFEGSKLSGRNSSLGVPGPMGVGTDYSGNVPSGDSLKMTSPATPEESSLGYQQTDRSSGSLTAKDPAADKKIIKNGNLNLRVDSVDRASEKISEIAKSKEGEVFLSNFNQRGTNTKSGNVTIKVPVKNFENTFSELKKIAIVVVTESTSGTDVTEQYVDLQAQLKNKQAEEQSYVRLLDQAQKMEDIIAITRQLSTVRGEIERIQGRVRYMDSQTDMSTISVALSEDTNVTIVDSWRPWQVVKESARELIKSVQSWIDFIIKLVIIVVPVILLYGIILYMFYRIGRWIYFKFRKKDVVQ